MKNKKILGIKHCPFCGSRKCKPILADPILKAFRILCENCFALGPIKATRNKAVLAWHTRRNSKPTVVKKNFHITITEGVNNE